MIEEIRTQRMKKCPWCGSRNVVVVRYIFEYPETIVFECVPCCDDCGYSLEDFSTVDEAVAEWNDDFVPEEYKREIEAELEDEA